MRRVLVLRFIFCNKFIHEVFHNNSFNSTELTVQRRTTCNDFGTNILSSSVILRILECDVVVEDKTVEVLKPTLLDIFIYNSNVAHNIHHMERLWSNSPKEKKF